MGSVALGRLDTLLAGAEMPPQRRHAVDLMPTVDALCRAHGATPRDLLEVYVSVGPGSFTGLRIGVTTAKTLAFALGVKVVAIPTLDVLACRAPAADHDRRRLAVRLNVKAGVAWTGLYRPQGSGWTRDGEPSLLSLADLLAAQHAPLWILADPAAEDLAPVALAPGVQLLPAELAQPRATDLWRLGREASARGAFADPLTLAPLYARRPEAEELWDKRLAQAAAAAPASDSAVSIAPSSSAPVRVAPRVAAPAAHSEPRP